MKRLDQIILSLPLMLSLAAIYFVLVWKPLQSDARIVARASSVFWSTAILMVVAVVVYASFFRG
jgi:cytochrome c biogenesis factor